MDIFKFHNPNAPTKMEQGEIINGLTSKTWIERYRDSGEFTLKAPVSSGLKDILPIGTFISHVDTEEIMSVENHEINEDATNQSDITITGRGFETSLENRMIGSNNIFPMSGSDLHYDLASDYTWNQVVDLIIHHIYDSYLYDVHDDLPFVTPLTNYTGTGLSSPVAVARPISKGPLYTAVIDLLKIDNLGIKVVRPNPSSTVNPNTAFIVHRGVDRTKDVAFSYSTGEIVTADYLWSNKKLKNAALISGRYVQTVVTTGPIGYARRWAFIDASDIDSTLSAPPVGGDLYAIAGQMQVRGYDALKSQNLIALTKAQVSKEGTKAVYRKDYDLGDLITVHGDFNESAVMRVTEYAEVEDNTGSSGYPTLSVDGG